MTAASPGHYEELGISPDATGDEIRSAYRQAALEHHPDKNPEDPSAHVRFQRIQEAYSVLSDPHERAWYDSQRKSGKEGGWGGGGSLCVDLNTPSR